MHGEELGVEVRDLTVSYSDVLALDQVSLSWRGGVTGLLGPNGAGKTTLFSVLVGQRRSTEGSVTVGGHDMRTVAGRRASLGAIGYLPQRFDLANSMHAIEAVEYAAWCNGLSHRGARRAAVDALQTVDLADRARIRIRKLSGGERQRLGLAAAVAHDPPILLLDEPTVGLDPEQRVRFRRHLVGLKSRRTIVLATHLLEDIAFAAERVIVLSEGHVAFDGAPKTLSTIGRRSRPLTAGEDHSTLDSDLERGYRSVLNDPNPQPQD